MPGPSGVARNAGASPTGPRWFALTWLAAMRLGAVATPINFRLAAGEIAHVIDDSLPATFIFDVELDAQAREALDLASHSPGWTAVVGADFDQLLAGDAAPPPLPDRDLYGETTRLYTSGTTGLPKGVSLNDAVEVMSAHDVIMHFPLAPDDVTLNMTPWSTAAGSTRAARTRSSTSALRRCRCARSTRRRSSTWSPPAGSPSWSGRRPTWRCWPRSSGGRRATSCPCAES